MSNRYERSMEIHKKGYNCCQCVLLAFSDLTGLDEQTAMNISAGYGSGTGTGELCGAITGAVMVLGLLTPVDQSNPVASKQRTTALSKELQARFKARFEAVRCQDLLAKAAGFQVDDNAPTAKAMGLTKHCDVMIVTAIEIVEQMLAEREAQ